MIALTRELVRLPSHPGVPRQEEAVATALAGWLRDRGLDPSLVEVVPGRPNLLCTVRGRRPGRHLLLCGHTDTVPLNADGAGYGFSGEVVEPGARGQSGAATESTSAVPKAAEPVSSEPSAAERSTAELSTAELPAAKLSAAEPPPARELRGRGSADMKGAVAAMAVTLAELAAHGLDAGAVTLAAVVDEEMESLGAEHLVRHGLAALAAAGLPPVAGAIVGEPTGNQLCRGHKGLEWLEIELVGRAAHGGTPQAGINAINAAAHFLILVERDLQPRLAARVDPLLGPPTFNVGTIRGGDQPSTVAGRCVLAIDRRTVPGESYEQVVAEIEDLLATVRAAMPGLATSVRRMDGGMATMEHLPLLIAAEHPLVEAVDAARLEVGLATAPHGAFPAWTDGALLANFGGVPTLVLGPGDLALAHGPREAVPVAELVAAVGIYTAAARIFTSGEESETAQETQAAESAEEAALPMPGATASASAAFGTAAVPAAIERQAAKVTQSAADLPAVGPPATEAPT